MAGQLLGAMETLAFILLVAAGKFDFTLSFLSFSA